MPGKILVINGHGAKIAGSSVVLDPDHAIVTPGIASGSYSLSFDNQDKHLEQKTHQGKIWPIIDDKSGTEVSWEYYDNGEVPDIEIAPLQSDFDVVSFFKELNEDTTGWNDLTDPSHDPVAEGVLAVKLPDGTISLLEGVLLTEFINNFTSPSDLQPLFYCDKQLGKIKPLTETTLAEIYEAVKLISDFRESGSSLVVATCSQVATEDMKSITLHTRQPAMTFEKLFETELNVTSAKKLIDPEEYKPKIQAAKVASFGLGNFKSRIKMHAGPITDIAIESGKKGAIATARMSDLTKYFGFDFKKLMEIDFAMEAEESSEKYERDQPYTIRQTSEEMKRSHNIDQVEFMVMPPIRGNTLEKMFYEALVHSKDLDYIIFPVIKLNNNYDECARFSINAFRRFIQEYPDSKLKIIFSADDKLRAEKSYKEYAKLVEIAMNTNFEEITSSLEHGPRQKTQATKDLETICKALLDGNTQVSCSFNSMDEIEITVGDKKYNLTSILKNNADFEQLDLSDEEVEDYAHFIFDRAVIKPMFKGMDEVPTEEDYAERDRANRHKDLGYGEKLAITLYSGNHMYHLVNSFLRSDGTLPDYVDRSNLDTVVTEVLLVSALATKALSKVATRGLTIPVSEEDPESDYRRETFYSPPIHEPIYRTEKPSAFHDKRQKDIEEGKVTQQKGFTSTTESTRFNVNVSHPVKQVIHTVRRPGLKIQHVAELCWRPAEMEVMHPPGSEFKYYVEPLARPDETHGIPVRTIASERQYQYGTEQLRSLRREILNELGPFIVADKFDEAMPQFLQWLKALNLTEQELKYFDDVYNFINTKLTKKQKKLEEEMQKIEKLDDEQIDKFLITATQYDSLEFIKTVLRHYPRNANKLFLMTAIDHDSEEVARYMLDHVRISDVEATHMFSKALYPFHSRIVRMMVRHGFSVTEPLPLLEGKSAIAYVLDKFFKKNTRKYLDAICSPKTAYELAAAIFQLPDDKRRFALQTAVGHPDFLNIIGEPDFGQRIAGPDVSRQRSVKTQAMVAAVTNGMVSELGLFYPDGLADKDLMEMLQYSLKLDATDPLGFEMMISILFTYITKQDSVPATLSESLDMMLGSEWFARQDANDKREIIFNMKNIDHKIYAKWLLAGIKSDPEMLSHIKTKKEMQMSTVLLAIGSSDFELARMIWHPEFRDFIITDLYLAFAGNNSDKIQFFASLGLDATYRFPSDSDSLLHLAIRRGHAGVVRNLLGAAPPPDVNAENIKGETPFSLAVENVLKVADEDRPESIELVRQLLKSGANIRSIDLEKLEETVVGIIKSLPKDSDARAEYISKLQDPNSLIAAFINSISGPQASPTLFTTKGSSTIENILSKLEVQVPAPKPSGSRD